ncbi:MAG TPA: ABC transporter permease, partial [Alphaproteobacteria bacterium]|nr:ABC transporter permease [Alphaproteobacteria bacterium]
LRGALGQIATRTYAVIEVYLLMAVLYLILTTIITRLLRLLELRLTPYHRPRVDVDPVPVPATGPH